MPRNALATGGAAAIKVAARNAPTADSKFCVNCAGGMLDKYAVAPITPAVVALVLNNLVFIFCKELSIIVSRENTGRNKEQ